MNEMKFDNQPIITERLCLCSVRDEDADGLLSLFTNDEVGKTYMLPKFKSRDEAVRLVSSLQTMSAAGAHFIYGICLNDRLIGLINDVGIDGGEIELGYAIHPDYKNKGYASEALKKSIEILFEMGLSVIKAGAFEENLASMRVMEK